jgi:hypothetical protein
MSSDYRPRNGGSRGGRRNPRRRRDYDRPQNNRTPDKQKGLFEKLFGWLFKKGPKTPVNRVIRTPSQNGAPRPERAPKVEVPLNPEDITNPKLYVGNLSYDAAESDLFDLFSQVGAVKNVEVVMDRHSNRSKGFGFVEMEALETARAAAVKYNRTDFMGRQIVVSSAKAERRERAATDTDTLDS